MVVYTTKGCLNSGFDRRHRRRSLPPLTLVCWLVQKQPIANYKPTKALTTCDTHCTNKIGGDRSKGGPPTYSCIYNSLVASTITHISRFSKSHSGAAWLNPSFSARIIIAQHQQVNWVRSFELFDMGNWIEIMPLVQINISWNWIQHCVARSFPRQMCNYRATVVEVNNNAIHLPPELGTSNPLEKSTQNFPKGRTSQTERLFKVCVNHFAKCETFCLPAYRYGWSSMNHKV